MPKPAKKVVSAPKLKVDNRVQFMIGDDEYKGTVTTMNKDGSFEVESDDEQKFEFEAKEAKDVTVLDEEPEAEAEPEPEEEEKPKKPAKKAKVEEEEEQPKKKAKGGSRSLASAWKSAERAERSAGGLPIGNHEAIIVGGEASETDKGLSMFFTFAGVGAEAEDKHQRKYYQLFDADGEPLELGIGYLKADLHDIGLDDDDINDAVPECDNNEEFIEALNKLAKKIGKARPWLSIRVVAPKKAGYSNTIYIQGLMEDQDQKPELDEDNIPY